MDFITVCFFFVVPVFFGLLQFFVTRSKRISTGRKYIPLAVVGSLSALTWGAVFGWIPLPHTYWINGGGGFIAFPDFAVAGLFCIPALAGLAFGAVVGAATHGEEGANELE